MANLKKFTVEVTTDKDGLYVATVKELKGCHTQAPVLPTLFGRLCQAIELCQSDEPVVSVVDPDKALKVSDERMREIAAILDGDIDTSDIPELDKDFFSRAKLSDLSKLKG